ncbi:MAG: SMC-Scp complex subunit ScpB [Phycisphaerales bacterium]|nr:SMC-Scp complex subunit ScpB [Phycisphaerales bacterium]
MEDATAMLSATECVTGFASTGADQYVNESGDRQGDAQAAHSERAASRKAKRERRKGGETVSRRTLVRGEPIGSENAADSVETMARTSELESNAARESGRNTAAGALVRENESLAAPAAFASPESACIQAESEVEAPPTAERIIEALLFASDAPLSAGRIADLVGGVTPAIVNDCIELLNADYAASGRAFRITAIAGGYQMLTRPAFQPWLAKLDKHRGQNRLGDAALEVLSVIAYKQPIIRAEVEAIRGVACGDVMNRLRDMGLIKAVGRAEVVGRPLLYGTTRKFLDAFGLEKLEDLPPLEAIQLKSKPAASG